MKKIIRNFPLPRIQCGAMLGNGKLGAELWGKGSLLNLSLGCADLWDHRGGMEWTPVQNFGDLRAALEKGDEERIRKMFASLRDPSVSRPTLVPLGRVVIQLPPRCILVRYEQWIHEGVTKIVFLRDGEEACLDFCADMSARHGMECRGMTTEMKIRLIPSWELPCDENNKKFELSRESNLKERGFVPPEIRRDAEIQAFCQPFPADMSAGVLLRRKGNGFILSLCRGAKNVEEVEKLPLPEEESLFQSNRLWWKKYWKRVPSVTLPDKELEELYFHGMYKYGIMTNPAGVTPGLQGPWIEDDRLPPWSGDYHFNINVQMCNAPGLKAGLFDHLRPLFEMILSWKPKLRHNARCFAGIEDGYMLPHAVDDRGTCMGGFWTGSIDHACAAWAAMMMFDYCRYSGDREFLRDQVFDFMQGVMRVFEVMLEPDETGNLRLPVSISPEYRDSAMDAWGVNSSFQLAAIHNLARNLIRAAEMLGREIPSFCRKVEKELPAFSLFRTVDGAEIGLWDGLALQTSHRHHSHLGGIVPFATIDPDDPALHEVMENTLRRWTALGMGEWTGWCVPWASQLRTRFGHPDMAVELLHLWKKNFTNEGGASLHDACFPGFTIYADFRGEIMQMDGAMGAVAAIQDMLVCEKEGVLTFFRGIPRQWKRTAFKGIFLPGGFRADAVFREGVTEKLTFRATRDGVLKFRTADCPEICTRTVKRGEILSFTADGALLKQC